MNSIYDTKKLIISNLNTLILNLDKTILEKSINNKELGKIKLQFEDKLKIFFFKLHTYFDITKKDVVHKPINFVADLEEEIHNLGNHGRL